MPEKLPFSPVTLSSLLLHSLLFVLLVLLVELLFVSLSSCVLSSFWCWLERGLKPVYARLILYSTLLTCTVQSLEAYRSTNLRKISWQQTSFLAMFGSFFLSFLPVCGPFSHSHVVSCHLGNRAWISVFQVLFEFDIVQFPYHFLICALRNVPFKANFIQKSLILAELW